jgi:SAM-dependent methyltransferase
MGEIFERPFPPQALNWTGERLTTETTGQTEIEHLHRYFFARSLCRGLDVLDIASGEGYGAAMLAQVARSVTGVEISAEAVEHAQRAYDRPNLRYLAGDARRIPLDDQSVDVVVSFETIEHFFEHDDFIAEVRRVLRPGGRFIVSSPERDVYSPAGSAPNPHHVRELTRAEFDVLLRNAFPHVALYAQRPMLGSALVPEDQSAPGPIAPMLTYERRDTKLFEASVGLPRPIYLLAIASDMEVMPNAGSLYIETSGVEAIFARAAQAKAEVQSLTERLVQEGEYAQRVQAELNRRDEQLARQVAEAQDWHQQLVRRNEAYAEVEARLAAATAEAGALRAEIGQARGQQDGLRQQAAELATVQAELAEARALLELASQHQETLEQQAAERDVTAQAELTRLHRDQAALRQALETERAALRSKLALVAQQRARQSELAQAHAALLQRHEALQREHAADRHRMAWLETEVDSLQSRHDAVLKHFDAIRTSTSWRLTGPLRGLAARHPDMILRLREFAARHPRLRRMTIRTVRGTWRMVTLRSARTPVLAAPPALLSVSPLDMPASALPAPLDQTTAQDGLRFDPRRIVLPHSATPHPEALRHGTGRRALCVGHVMPYPPRAGNEYRVHRLLHWLASDNWDVTVLLCPLPGEMPSEQQIVEAAQIYPRLIVCAHDGRVWYQLPDQDAQIVEGMRGQPVPAAAAMLGETEHGDAAAARMLQLQRSFCPDLLVELLRRLDAGLRPDMLLAEYIFMTRPFSVLRPEIVKVIDTIDVFSTKARKVEQYGVTDGLAIAEQEEAALLSRAEVLIGIQPDEAADLARLAPASEVVSIGVDFPVIEHAPPPPAQPVALLVASGNPMNVKGLRDFLRFSWPLVRQAVPEAELRVVGSVGDSLLEMPEGVRILGRVARLDTEYAMARVAINPTVAGTGLKIKTVEALCHMRPVVLWPAGAEGIWPEAKPFCHVATHWAGFARHLAWLLTDDAAAGAILAHRDTLAHAASPEVIYAPLRQALNRTIASNAHD